MMLKSIALRGGLFILLFSPAALAGAQRNPLPIPQDIRSAEFPLTADQRRVVADYVNAWLPRINPAPGEPRRLDEIHSAKRALTRDVFSATVGPQFRRTYSELVAPHLREILEGTDDRAAVDALFVASQVGTDEALDLIIGQLDSPSPERRNAAAGRAKLAVRDFQNNRNLVSQGTMTTLGRKVATVAEDETVPFALQRQLELLDAISAAWLARQNSIQGEQAKQNRIDVFGARAERLKPEEVSAITMMVRNLKGDYIARNSREKRADGPAIARHLITMLKTIGSSWDEGHADSRRADAYRRLIFECENFLTLIDPSVRDGAATPGTNLAGHWANADQLKYDQDLATWEGVVSEPAYRRGG